MSAKDTDLDDLEDAQPRRNSNYRGRGHRKDGLRAWDYKNFIAWDGEGVQYHEPTRLEVGGRTMAYVAEDGTFTHAFECNYKARPQPYVLLANSTPDYISDPSGKGLSTHDCLEFMLDTATKHPDSIHVGFGFNYDVNQVLADLSPHHLWMLHDKGYTHIGGYYLKWVPRKFFIVNHNRTGRKLIIYDTFSFFGKAFSVVCDSYLGKDHPHRKRIVEGKAKRELFSIEDLEDYIIPYNAAEVSMLAEIMTTLRKDFHHAGVVPDAWYGPGAVASATLKKFHVTINRDNIPNGVEDASQFAFAGGWFEQFQLGRYSGVVYENDIHSAYPAALVQLPDLSDGRWDYVTAYQPGAFGIWFIDYESEKQDNRPKPLFCRSQNGSITHPCKVQGWYWGPEASCVPDHVREGWVFQPNTDNRPFQFVEEMYEQRRVWKSAPYNPAERALKLILNSLYGKLAQTVGWDRKHKQPPRWHQLQYAGWITSYTRAMIWKAIQQAPDDIIAVETDAVFSTVPLDLPHSEALGDWEGKVYTEITYLQSGLYYARKPDGEIVCRYRGMDKDTHTNQPVGMPFDRVVCECAKDLNTGKVNRTTVMEHLRGKSGYPNRPTPKFFTTSTRYVGLALGLQTDSVWRSWERKERQVNLDGNKYTSKRYHDPTVCPLCQDSISMWETLHPLYIGGYSGQSRPRRLPWRETPLQATSDDMEELAEINDDWITFGRDMDLWQ